VENGYKLIGVREYKETVSGFNKVNEAVKEWIEGLKIIDKTLGQLNIPSGISIKENVAEVDLEKVKKLIDEQVSKVKNAVIQILER
jgi:hypothetical protein